MQIKQKSLWYKLMAMILVLTLLVPVLAACDDDDEPEKTTPIAVKTTELVQTTDPTSTNLPFIDDPVKIGAVMDWSGPGALAGMLTDQCIKYLEWYFNERQNGIVVGDVRRPVKVIKGDNQGTMAGTTAVTKKLIHQEKVTAVTMGGTAQSFGYGVLDVSESASVPYFSIFGNPDIFENYKYSVACFFNPPERSVLCARLIVEYLKAKRVAILCYDIASERQMVTWMKDALKTLDPEMDIVYEEYPSIAATEFSPYLTAMKYKNPDVLVTCLDLSQESSIAKQIMELGGWGDIQHVGLVEPANFIGALSSPGAQGTLAPAVYDPSYDVPGAVEFTKLWTEKFGSPASSNYVPIYNSLVMAVRAVEFAGTDDPVEVAKAARSGNFEAETPMGMVKVGTNGMSSKTGFYLLIKDGKTTLIDFH